MRKPEDTEACRKAADELLRYMKVMPRSTDNLRSTWCPPDWEQVVGWWDKAKDIAEGKP